MDETLGGSGFSAVAEPLATHETEYMQPPQLEELRQYREDVMLEKVRNAALGALEPVLRTPLDKGARQNLLQDGRTSWTMGGSLQHPISRHELQILGMASGDPDIVRKAWRLADGEKLEVPSANGVVMSVLGDRSTTHAISWGISSPSAAAAEEFLSSLEQAPAIQSLRQVKEALERGEKTAYGDTAIPWNGNADVLLAFLRGSGSWQLLSARDRQAGLMSPAGFRQTEIDALYTLPYHYPGDPVQTTPFGRTGIYFDKEGNIEKILVDAGNIPGLYVGLVPSEVKPGNIDDHSYHMGIEIAPEELQYNLDYNGRRHEGVKPFLYSEAGGQLLTAFDSVGLRFNDSMKRILSETESSRYGGAYSNLTREIAKLVNDSQRPLTEVFSGEDEQSIRQGIQQLARVENAPAQTVIDLLKGVEARGRAEGENAFMTQLPVSQARVKLGDGACKDVETYIADGPNLATEDGSPPVFRRSTYAGRKSVMTLRPMVFNSVLLPAGSLLAIEPDGYLLMRVTGFAFNNENAMDAFGAQEAENREHTTYKYLRQNMSRY